MSDGDTLPLLMDVGRAARELSMSPRTIGRMIRGGELVTLKRGRRRLISKAEVERWIADHTPQPTRQRSCAGRAKAVTGHAAKAEIEAMLKRKAKG